MIQNSCVEIQTSSETRPSVPDWFAEVAILSSHLASQGVLEAFQQQVLLKRKRFGIYEPIDFLAILIGYAISGERTLAAFFARVAPFEVPFMALFGRRSLPARATLSRFLLAVDPPSREAFRNLFQHYSLALGWMQDSIGGLLDRQNHRWIVFDIDGTRQAARQRALLSTPDAPAAQRRLDEVCAIGYQGRSRGEVVRTRTTVNQAHTRQWLGTYGHKGNGQYREELASALDVIALYLKFFALSIEIAILRLDGLYGDPAVIAQLVERGYRFITRGKCYGILEHPLIVLVLAQPPAATVTSKTGVVTDLFEGGWLSLEDGGPLVRIIVTRTPAPTSKKKLSVGKRIGDSVYSLYVSVLPQDGFAPQDILDLYHGRGSFEGVLADEDSEQDPDRWCSFQECGQEVWQIASQWVWNLRLTLGQKLQEAPLRDIEWAPATSIPAQLVIEPDAQQEYGPWQVAEANANVGHKASYFGPDQFLWQEDGTLQCPTGTTLRQVRRPHEDHEHTQRSTYKAHRADCVDCPLQAQCRLPSHKGAGARSVTVLRRALPPPLAKEQLPPVPLGPMRWMDISARGIRRTWMTHWRGQQVEILVLDEQAQPVLSPPRPPREVRSHERWNWQDKQARNAWHGPPQYRIKIAGVPTFLCSHEP
jgi:hypothetical protein